MKRRLDATVERLLAHVPLVRRPFYQRDEARRLCLELADRLAALEHAAKPPSCDSLPPCQPDLKTELRSLAAWEALLATQPNVMSAAVSDAIVAHGVANGVDSAFSGKIVAEDVELCGPNHREQYLARGLNARQRALLDLLHEAVGDRSIYDVRIYAHEGSRHSHLRCVAGTRAF